jgi:uncharacterized membrane protein YczE
MARPTPAVRDHLVVRMLQLHVGLMLFGVGISALLGAGIGLDPWSTFHSGLADRLGVSFGTVVVAVGLVLVAVAWAWFRERPGPGTLFNMALVGPWVDVFRSRAWFPVAEGLAWGVAQFATGLAIVGLASGLYIAARLGAGPRDSFMLGLARRSGLGLRWTRIGVELVVLAIGFALGGAVGLGTVLFALAMGPLMQAFLRLFGALPTRGEAG